MPVAVIISDPPLPAPRGPLSAALLAYLRGDSSTLPCRPVRSRDAVADEDLQLALYCCYELHYRGFASVPGAREWDPDVLRFRDGLERAFTRALFDAVPQPPVLDPRDAGGLIESAIASFDGPSLSAYLADDGSRAELAEFLIHRSAYQRKEADPHTWAIPRFAGRARAALVEIQMDEYGNGVPGAAHADLFATTMQSFELDPTYGAYLDRLPAPTLATSNLVSMFGLHRRWLPALLGHLALFEMTSVEPMGRYARAIDRHGLGAAARRFYDVHVEADAYHGPLAQRELVGGYVDDQPQDAATVVWGALALLHVEARFTAQLLDAWAAGRSSLRAVDSERTGDTTTAVPARPVSKLLDIVSLRHRWDSVRELQPRAGLRRRP